MKVCFILQRRFAYIGHEIAKALKKKGVAEFCGYVYLRDSLAFLKNQSEIAYTKLLLDEDVHEGYRKEELDMEYLRRLEKDYGLPNLWPYLELDRVIRHGQLLRDYPYDKAKFTHEEMLRILQAKSKAILEFLDSEKPDALLLYVIADLSTLFLYEVAKKRGIKVLFLESARIGSRHTVTEDYRTLSYAEEVFKKLRQSTLSLPEERAAAESFLASYRQKPVTHSHQDTPEKRPVTRTKQWSFLSPARIFPSLIFNSKLWLRYLRNPHRRDLYTIKPWHHTLDRFKRKMRVLYGFEDLYDAPAYHEPFAFFPLQLEPEMATSLFSKFYTDQLWLVAQAARALPVGMLLYVKEHPAMYGYRPRSFYKKLKRIPNVKLIPPTESGQTLIRNTKLVLTLTGSSGWEALLLGKPVITFGDVFYNALALAVKCEYINDLPELVTRQLSLAPDDSEMVDLITAIMKESVELDIITMWEMEASVHLDKYMDQFGTLADFLMSKITSKIRQ